MLRIRNWDKFQHYKSGRGAPPWIKLYRDLLNDKEWHSLDPAAAKFLISCFLLSAEYDGALPDSDTLAFRFRMSSKEIAKNLSLCNHWIIEDASNTLAECYQLATPETETEKEKNIRAPRFDDFLWLKENGVSDVVASGWLSVRKKKKQTNTEIAFAAVRKEAEKAGMSLNDALTISVSKSWAGFSIKWLDSAPEQKAYKGNEV